MFYGTQNAFIASETVFFYLTADYAKAEMFRLRGIAASLNMTSREFSKNASIKAASIHKADSAEVKKREGETIRGW